MNKSPIFSVIIPAYNRDDTITRALQSVLCQTFKNFEIIVVDDGSTDDTIHRIDKFHDERIKVYRHEKNLGQIAATNTAISNARGKFLAFLDSDDAWMPDMLLKQLEAYNSDNDVSCVYTHMDSIHFLPDGKITQHQGERQNLSGYISKEVLTQGYLCTMSSLGAKRSCFDDILPLDMEFTSACRDDEICIQLANKYKFLLIPEVLVLYFVDAKLRIAKNKRIPYAWWYFFNKHKYDIIEKCGYKILAKHFLNCSRRFLLYDQTKNNIEMAEKAFFSAYDLIRKYEHIDYYETLKKISNAHTINVGEDLPALRMELDEAILFLKTLQQVSIYIEFGSGGSTGLAVNHESIKKIYSVESDGNWLNKLLQYPKIIEATRKKRLSLIHADIGPTTSWGFPAGTYPERTTQHPYAFAYKNYFWVPWEMLPQNADYIFIDGRFRVACALLSAMFIENDDCLFAIHDYKDYTILQNFFVEKFTSGSLYVFTRKNPFPYKNAMKILHKYIIDPY